MILILSLLVPFRGLHGPVFFRPGPFNSGPARPVAVPGRSGPARPARFQLGPARCRRGKKRTVLKTTKKHRLDIFLPFFAYITFSYITCFLHAFWVLVIISCRPGPARLHQSPARPGPFKLIYFPARARPAGHPARADL